jgi:type I restriction enzyme M protein
MNPRSPKMGKELDALDKMIEEITVDAYGDDEQLWVFRQAFEDNVDLPANLFYGTGIPAALMIFDKSRKPNGKGNVLFIDASREFAQNTNQNKLRPQDIDNILNTFQKRKTIDKYSYLASYAEIEENEFNLNIPRYVDTFEPEGEIDIAGVQQEIEQIEAELVETQKKMNNYLKELGF